MAAGWGGAVLNRADWQARVTAIYWESGKTKMEFRQLSIIFVLIGYLALCFGLVAKRNGRNP